ncbi:MAG: hypothetical protein ACD_46C00272G0002 [uncultured bacterium]|nr:MAG: hypothetical protein ACD_46C00272G0002 [uncultured bacterium]
MPLKTPKEMNLKYILHLALLYIMVYLAADSVAYKMVSIGSTLEPGPPFIFPISYAIADIIAEVYGYTIAKKIIWLTLFYELLFSLVVTLIIKLPSPGFWSLQHSYDAVFGNMIRFVLSGITAVVSSSFINVYIISKWKIFMKGEHFWLRSIGASAIGGFVLIVVIMIFGYSGTMTLHNLIIMFVSIYIVELIYAVLLAWPAWLLTGFLKLKENMDVYDTKTNFNPFSFK